MEVMTTYLVVKHGHYGRAIVRHTANGRPNAASGLPFVWGSRPHSWTAAEAQRISQLFPGSFVEVATTYIFQPVGLDVYDARSHQPAPGTLVRKVQPHGCPRNGTFGHCYVEEVATGRFCGLVLVNSLTKVGAK